MAGQGKTSGMKPLPPIPPRWRQHINAWLVHQQAAGLRPDSLYTHRQRVERAARHLRQPDPWSVTEDDLLNYVGTQTWATETRRGHRTSLRRFYGWAEDRGHMDRSPARALPRVKPMPPNPRPAPDHVYLPALAQATPRERLMLRLAAEHGLRRGEIVQVRTQDVIRDLIGSSLVVHGKGGRERTVPLLGEVLALLEDCPGGYVFPGDHDGHMSARWCGTLINRLLPGDWTIHKLRHRAATEWWEASDHDLLIVAELLGHASTVTTQLYVRTAQHHHRAVMQRARDAGAARQRLTAIA